MHHDEYELEKCADELKRSNAIQERIAFRLGWIVAFVIAIFITLWIHKR